MPAKDARSPDQISKSIEKKATAVRSEAARIGVRIEQFVDHLAAMPGRVEAYCYGPHPDGNHPQYLRQLVLHFHRDGKGWGLSYGTYQDGYNDDPDNPISFSPLSQAPLKYKLAAMKMFPDLLTAMEDEQDRLVQNIQRASAEFDAFMATLKPGVKGGE